MALEKRGVEVRQADLQDGSSLISAGAKLSRGPRARQRNLQRRGAVIAKGGYEAINLREKCRLISSLWQPRVIAELNDYQFKVVRVEGDFVWHDHPDTDEAFLVLDGALRIDLPGGSVQISEGELFVVPKGLRHKPYAEAEASVLVIEPRGVPNTGSAGGDRTAEQDIWI